MFFTRLLAIAVLFISVVFAGAIEEQNTLTQKCETYTKEISKKDIGDVYPFFLKEGKEVKKNDFAYLNLNAGKTDAFIRLYEFKNTSLQNAYENLKSILKNNANIKIRSILPKVNAEDALKFQVSVGNENDGHTCYIYKNPNELWIKSIPQKGEEFVFILKQVGENSKLYYYGKITLKD